MIQWLFAAACSPFYCESSRDLGALGVEVDIRSTCLSVASYLPDELAWQDQ